MDDGAFLFTMGCLVGTALGVSLTTLYYSRLIAKYRREKTRILTLIQYYPEVRKLFDNVGITKAGK